MPTKHNAFSSGHASYCQKIPTNVKMEIQDDIIETVTHVKNLGIFFDRYMTYDKHINEINRKVMGTLIHQQN